MRGILKFSIAAAVIGVGSLLISYIGGPSKAAIDNTPDCDTVAIVYCGTFSESEFHKKWNNDTKYKDHATIFSAFGINKSDVTGMVEGVVWRDGRVTLGSSAGGQVVATNATTAGRWNNPKSGMTKIAGTDRAYKMSTSNFVTEGQTAMIKMINGQFKFAVLKSCGNPVVGTPKAQPEALCVALANPVITDRTRVSLASTASAKNGATISEHIFTIHDASGKQINQHRIATTATTAKTDFIIATPGTYTAKVAIRTSLGDIRSTNCEKKFTIKPEAPKPTAKCDALDTPVITNRTNVALSARASVENGATISGYVFTVADSTGKQVATKTVNTSAKTASTSVVVSNAGTYTAKVSVKTSLGDKTSAACEKQFTIKKEDKPGVSIEKTVNGVKEDIVAVDQPFTYELVVKNTGNVDLKNVKVEDKAPAGVTFKSASVGSISNNTWTHTIADLKVGAEAKFTITAIVSEYFEDGRKNTACVDAPTVPGNPDDCDDAKIKVKKPGVNITKKVDGVDHKAVEANVEFTYQIRVSNTGETDLKNVVVTDEAEQGVTFIKASHGTVNERSWTYTIPELKKGAHMDFTITAKVPEYKAGTIKNTVCVDAPSVPGNPDDCDDATVEVPKPGEETVCRLEDKKYPVTIKEGEFDESLHSRNPADCAETPVTPPTELPKTGAGDNILSTLGIGALTTSILAYIASRRNSLIG